MQHFLSLGSHYILVTNVKFLGKEKLLKDGIGIIGHGLVGASEKQLCYISPCLHFFRKINYYINENV